jgi:hypothetical protein
MARPLGNGLKRRVQLRIIPQLVDVFDSYTAAQQSELMNRALASMAPGIDLGDRMVSVVRPANPVSNTICRLFVRATQIQLLYPEKSEDFRDVVKGLDYEWSAPFWLKTVESELRVDRAAEVAHRLLLAGFVVQVESEAVKEKAIAASYEPEHYRKITASTAKPWDGWFQITWPRAEDLFDEVKKITAAKWSSGAMYVPPEMFREVRDFADINDFWLTPEAEMLIQQAEQAWEQVLIACPQEHKKRQRRQTKQAKALAAGIPDDLRDDD